MRRFVSWTHWAVAVACLLALGVGSAARAEIVSSPFERFVASWMGVVGVIGGADEESEADDLEDEDTDDDRAHEIADDDSAEKREREHRHRDGERAEGDRHRRHGGHGRHGDHGDRPHHRPHHPGMGPDRMGPPGGPDMHHMAMRGFQEIIRRLARIEQKLGIENAPPSGPTGDRPRRPEAEMRGPRRPEGSAERPMPRLDIPEDMRRKMEERMQEGRRRMEEAKGRMEEARKRFQAMEERIKQLEAEVERLKAAK